MKARFVLGTAAVLVCAAGFGCETAHPRSCVSYPDGVMQGSSDSLGYTIFSPSTQDRMYTHKLEMDAQNAVAGADDNAQH